ncbi:MAG: hypothetical protein IJ040_01700 [Lachnospiraceae bacterium]|nr:hypothetical protein [Lachnospiraceae bacterium]
MWIGNTSDAERLSFVVRGNSVTKAKDAEVKKNDNNSNNIAIDGIAFSLSAEGMRELEKKKMEEQKQEEKEKKLQEQQQQLEMLQMQLDSIQEQTEASEEGWDALGKCLTIALRITNGDNVPPSDIQFLQEHNQELFMQAMSMRMPKKDPEDYESILEEEKEDNEESGASVVDSGMDLTSIESAAPESGTASAAAPATDSGSE